ncbi:MAG: hypothetical protein QOD41_1564 [Cryptosporangiaceae bacterium]|nr:hypothetical protein [Cryptosporangiaceae bacterium]
MSALALVMASLAIQRQQARLAHSYSVTQRQYELANLALENQTLLYAIEAPYVNREFSRGIYLNLGRIIG